MSPLTRLRLWISYQRYALLVSVGSLGATTLALTYAFDAWWLWVPLAVLCVPAFVLAHHIHRGMRGHMVTTRRALHKMRLGAFEPESVQPLCEAPCSRVVAYELLAQYGMPRLQRRALVKKLTLLEEEASKSLIIVDRTNGKLYRYDGGKVSSEDLGQLKEEGE